MSRVLENKHNQQNKHNQEIKHNYLENKNNTDL